MFISSWKVPQPRGWQAPSLTKEAGSNPCRGLPWGYGGVNICPTVVPAPDDTIEDADFDEILESIFETDEDDDFEDFIEYLDNQWW